MVRRKKWRYAAGAKRRRYCERCFRRLRKSEVGMCGECRFELAHGNTEEVERDERIRKIVDEITKDGKDEGGRQ